MAESSFKLSRPLEERIRACARLRKKHNGKIPLLLDKAEHSDLPAIDKNQMLVSEDFTIGQVEQMLRKVTNLAAEKFIFVFAKNTLCPSDASISAIYEERKDEDGFLYLTYSGEDLLFTMKTALGIADSMLREQGAEYIGYFSETWLPFLSTLEKLVSVSESHISLKESFEGLLKDRMDAFCSLVSCSAKEGDRVWVMKLRDFTNFEVRSHFTKLLFPSGLEEFEKLQIVVDRLSLFEESVKQISEATPLLFQGGISVSFKNEVAIGDGVFREWISVVCEELFDPSRKLFKPCAEDLRRFSLSPSNEDENNLKLFRFAGRIIALCLKHEVQVGILFDPLFFLQLRGQPISLEDVSASDKELYKSFKNILDMDDDEFDKYMDLGLEVEITEKSGLNGDLAMKERYIASEMKHLFETQIKDQLQSFSTGFEEMLSGGTISSFFTTLDLEDLDLMLRGSDQDSISVEEWKANTDYENFEESEDIIRWFWKVVEGFNQEQRRNLLIFWTGNRYLPRGGFNKLPMYLTISKVIGSPDSPDTYPSSRTCLFELYLPVYESYKKTKEKVLYVTQEHVIAGFGLL